MILIKNYYHMTSMDENVNWMKQTHLLSKKNLWTLRSHFVRLPLLINFEHPYWLYTIEKINTPPWRILCKLMPQLLPFSYTHISSNVVWRVYPLEEDMRSWTHLNSTLTRKLQWPTLIIFTIIFHPHQYDKLVWSSMVETWLNPLHKCVSRCLKYWWC